LGEQSKKDVLPVIRLTVRLNKPVEDVWEILTNPLLMIQWLGNEITADIKVGGIIRFMGKNAPTIPEMADYWEIKRLKDKRAILCSWRIMGVDTLFVLRLTKSDGGSILEVKHGAIPKEARNLYLPEHWNVMFANLKSVMELGEPALRFDYSNYRPLSTTRYDPTDLRLSVRINTPPQLPFDAFSNPEKLSHFIRAEKPKVDLRYAGIFTWWAEGKGPVVFTKVEQDKELEFSWVYLDEKETRVNIRFDPVDDSTVVALHHYGFEKPEDVIGYRIGWSSMLAELKLVCELGESGVTRLADWT